MTPDPTRFVLVGTSHAGNVGAAARAIKVMGFSDLVLVAPRWADVLQRDEAIAMASGATDVLERRARRRDPRRGARRRDLGRRDGDDAARLRPADLRAARGLRRAGGRRPHGSRSCSARSASACRTTTSTPATPASRSRPIRATARSTSPRRCSSSPTTGARRWAASPVEARRRRRRPGRCGRGARPGRALAAGADGDRLSRPGGAEEADVAAAPARQSRRADRGGGPHPARHRPSNGRAIPLNWPVESPSRKSPCSSACAKTSPASANAIRPPGRRGRC